jgi:hypothetical protein
MTTIFIKHLTKHIDFISLDILKTIFLRLTPPTLGEFIGA